MSDAIAFQNSYQEVYTQVLIANVLGGFVGTQTTLQTIANNIIPFTLNKVLPDWELQWGPTVWCMDPDSSLTGPDNVWYVTRNRTSASFGGPQQDTILVAIAGTAVFSKFDWKREDLSISTVVNYNTWTGAWRSPDVTPPPAAGTGDPTSPDGWMADGTSFGMYQLLANSPAGGQPTFIQWLTSLKDVTDQTRIIFSGHSLGGALSPALGIALTSTEFLSGLGFKVPDNVSVMAAAGASPGDGNLSNLFGQQLPGSGSGYQSFNYDFYNKYDIVPMAWSTGEGEDPDRNIDNITSVIYTEIENKVLKATVELALDKEKKNATDSQITYQPIKGQQFQGSQPGQITGWFQFIQEIILQHTTEYAYAIAGIAGVRVLQAVYGEYEKAAEGNDDFNKKHTRQAMDSFPITRYMEIPSQVGNPEENYPFDAIKRPDNKSDRY